MSRPADLGQGILDLLILKIPALEPLPRLCDQSVWSIICDVVVTYI
jgi:hypothetical protein